MFLGADAGALFAMTLHHFGCATGVPSGAFALVGMGATLAGTTKSPLLAMIMAFEISLDYSLMPPLMLACVVAVLVAPVPVVVVGIVVVVVGPVGGGLPRLAGLMGS